METVYKVGDLVVTIGPPETPFLRDPTVTKVKFVVVKPPRSLACSAMDDDTLSLLEAVLTGLAKRKRAAAELYRSKVAKTKNKERQQHYVERAGLFDEAERALLEAAGAVKRAREIIAAIPWEPVGDDYD